eukprot:g64997.t1
MEGRGWKMERLQNPTAIHFSISPKHNDSLMERLIADCKACIDETYARPELVSEGSAALYGSVAKIPSGVIVEQFLLKLTGKMYQEDVIIMSPAVPTSLPASPIILGDHELICILDPVLVGFNSPMSKRLLERVRLLALMPRRCHSAES